MSIFRNLEKSKEGSKLAVFELAQAIDASVSKVAQSHNGCNGETAKSRAMLAAYEMVEERELP